MTYDIALYIHVPFCRRRCSYCSFISYESREADILAYVSALKAELAQRADSEYVRSIYFGGGTPSLLPAEQVGGILATIDSLFTVDKAAEVTIEANPGTVDMAYLTTIRKLGVNRLSLGLQSLNNAELLLLGRIHTAAEVREAVQFARGSGFDNLSIDLIYGLPGQNPSDWQKTLDEAIAMVPEHLSLYSLTLEADTPIQQAINKKYLPDIDPDLSADQYELAEDLLAAHGYRHYEISNWALAGRECRHNLVYWRNRPYMGIGVAAHSYLGGHRLANTKSLDKYLAAFTETAPIVSDMDEEISPELQLAETVILGLRLCEGIDIDGFKSCFGIDILIHYRQQVDELAGCGLLECTAGYLKLTRRGRLLSNEVFWRFLPG